MTQVYIGSDHAGFELKEKIQIILKDLGYDPIDCGAFELDPQDDYPDFCAAAAKEVAVNPGSYGIVLGKSGAGECMVANKVNGIRAFLAINEKNVRLAREHNDANVMSIGSEFIKEEDLKNLIEVFLRTPFSNEPRHQRRIQKISQLEK